MTTYKGRWWMPSDEDHSWFGTMTYDQHDGITLEVNTPVRSGGDSIRAQLLAALEPSKRSRSAVLWGQARDGTRFTLYDGFLKGSSGGLGGSEAEWFFNHGIRGAWVPNVSAMSVNKAYARYDGLLAWVGVNPFTATRESVSPWRLNMTYEHQEETRIRIDERRVLLIAWTWNGPPMSIVQTDLSMSSSPLLGIEYASPVSPNDALEDIFSLSDLLTLLLGAPTTSLDIRFCSPDHTEQDGDRVYCVPLHSMGAYFRLKKSLAKWTPYDVLFPLPKIRGRFEAILGKWFDLRTRCWGAMGPYFSCQRVPSPWAENRFFEFARSAESVHRNLRPAEEAFSKSEASSIRRAMLGTVPETRKKHIEPQLSHLNELSYQSRLACLMERFPCLVGQVIGDTNAQQEFRRRVKNLRNTQAHGLGQKTEEKASGLALVRIAAKLKVLIDAWLLAEIGIPDEQIAEAMRENHEYWFYASSASWPWDKPV